jgi:methionyl-tRNA formyltransferase
VVKHRILFLGTPEIAVPCLMELVKNPSLEVAGVLTQPDRPAGRHMKLQASSVKLAAIENRLEVLTPETVRIPEVHDWVRSRNVESAVVVAFGQILPQSFLDLFSKTPVNVHASLLPRWRGAAPIQRSIMEGDEVTGVSLQVIVQKLDAGPLLGERRLAIDETTTGSILYEELKKVAPSLLSDEFMKYLKGELTPVEQDESQVPIARKIKKEEGLIDWKVSSKIASCRIRGLWMWPGSWTLRANSSGEMKPLKVWQHRSLEKSSGTPGEVIEVGTNSFVVRCGEGAIEVFEVQPDSRGKMAVSEYLKGYPMKKGERLG